MKQLFQKLMLPLLLLSSIAACKKSDVGGDTSGSDHPEANVIQGTIRDPHGHPLNIPGATVIVSLSGENANGDYAIYNAQMDENSHYRVKVSQGAYQMRARLYTPLNGKTVCIDLVPLDGRLDDVLQESAPGIVRDYGLWLTGLIPGRDPNSLASHVGAQISFNDGARNFTDEGYWNNLAARFPGATLQMLLTPKSALIDGSQGEPVPLSCKVEDIQTTYYFWDFPLAAYELTGKLITTDGQQVPLYFSELPNTNASQAITLLYEPNVDDHDGRPVIPNIGVWAQ